jgi:ketosteroid isomerase-like protein
VSEHQEHVDVVRRYFEATNRGDFPEAMAAYADDVVLVVDDAAIPTNAGTFTGREAVGNWFADWFRSFARGYRFTIEELRSVGERVFLVAHHDGRGRSSAIAIDWSLGYVFTVSNGKITRLELYSGRADAVKAVGLQE